MQKSEVHNISQIDKKVIIKDNIESIENIIKNSNLPLMRIEIRNPEPSQDFKLKYKKGSYYSEYHPWWKCIFHHNFEYKWNVYERSILINGNIEYHLYTDRELKSYIENKANYQAYLRYIFKENEKHQIWDGYQLHLFWKNKYGNQHHMSTIIYMISEDINEINEIVKSLEEKYISK